MVFPVVMCGCESWTVNKAECQKLCFCTMVLEETLESPLDYEEIQPVHPKGDQSWVFIERTDAEAETPRLWPPHVKSWLIGKDPDAGRDWRQEEKGDDRGWDGWMASPTRWKWVWVDSRSWWWLGGPGVLQFMGLQRVGHDWVIELNWEIDCQYFPKLNKSHTLRSIEVSPFCPHSSVIAPILTHTCYHFATRPVVQCMCPGYEWEF